jgi:hypothetical protein
VTEIEETRRRIEADLIELEERMPAPLRSMKKLVGTLVGSAVGVFVLKKLLAKRSSKRDADVVIRVVRDDEPGLPKGERERTWRSRRA